MAINPETQYPGKIAPSTPEYPYGAARNITVPGDGTGTPWEAAIVNDTLGFHQALLSEAGVVPTGTPEKATESQYLEALTSLTLRRFGTVSGLATATDIKSGDIVLLHERDNSFFVCGADTANGIDVLSTGVAGVTATLSLDQRVSAESLGGRGDYIIKGSPNTLNPSPTDNYPIVARAYEIGVRTLYFGNGAYAFNSGDLNVFTTRPFSMEGVGSVEPEIIGGTLLQIYTQGTVLVNNSSAESLFTLGVSTSFLTNKSSLRNLAVACSDAQSPNQHALRFTGHMQSFGLDNVSFVNITGYIWQWDTGGNPYSQNISWQNVSAWNVGGIMGSTADPTGSANEIFATLFTFDNFNLGHQINPTSPQPYICDFRGVRAINGNTFLLEWSTTGNPIAAEFIAFGSDENVVMENVHLEGRTAGPARWCTFKNTQGAEWLGDSNALIMIDGFEGAADGKFFFENTKQRVVINGFRPQTAFSSWDDLVEFDPAGYSGASLLLNNVDSRIGFKSLVPENLKGKLTVNYAQSTSASGTAIPAKNAPISSIATPLFRYRPNQQGDTKFSGVGTPYADSLVDGTLITDVVQTFSNTLVHSIARSDGRGGIIGFDFNLPAYLVGSKITVVARYYWEGDRSFEPFRIFDNDFDVEGEISRGDYQNNWVTAVGTFTAVKSVFTLKSNSATTGADAPVLHLAAYDIYLGCEYMEPLDVRKS